MEKKEQWRDNLLLGFLEFIGVGRAQRLNNDEVDDGWTDSKPH